MVNLTTEEAIKELSRYTDQEFYTPQNRAAHQMAIEALERNTASKEYKKGWEDGFKQGYGDGVNVGMNAYEWIPVAERLPEEYDKYLCNIKSYAFPGSSYQNILRYDKDGFHDGGIYEDGVTHWMPLPEAPDHQSNREHTGCEWCEPGHEVCGTCERFFSGLATGCATESTDEKCAVYVPADHCMKCGRSLRSPAGNDQKG